MNRWLKLAVSVCATLVLAVVGVVGPGMPTTQAFANEDTPTMVVAAKNTSVTVGADSSGRLYWSGDSGATWTASGAALSDHGVSSIVWNGSLFVASSYFQGATSVDGRTWRTFLLPVGSAFDPGNLISDEEFFTSGTMSVEEIQAFLNDQVPDCRDGYVCMKDYVETTFSRDQTVLCSAYAGAENESAAQIVFKVSEACGVSVEALLVLIQKEQSLVTHTWPSTWRYDKATGYACPDTAPCDERYFGFYNQVYNAAKQFKRYSNPPGTSRFFTWFPVGQTTQVRLHPNASCGTTPVIIRNQATAGLHYYTPYTPNTSAMVNISGVGDSCSAYGNRNFWRIYNLWFKKPTSFETMVTSTRGVTMAIDKEGGVAVSTTTQTWTRPSVIPTVSTSNPVLEFGTTPDGDFAVLTQAGTAFQSEDGGLTWKTLPVSTTERQDSTVVRHTVQPGDTVWNIASANGVAVAAVVDENSLPNNGATISVGQELTITKNGVVSTIRSPVIPDPSVVVLASDATEDETPVSETPAESSDAEESSEDSSATDTQTPSVPDPSYPPLEPLVVRDGQASTTTYVVKRGDTLWSIARANRTTVSSLASLNTVSNINRIFVGQRLSIGAGATTQQSFHRVQSGDTLPVISIRRSIALADLIRLNPTAPASGDLRDGTLIRVS
jgi:LysM repeat protein